MMNNFNKSNVKKKPRRHFVMADIGSQQSSILLTLPENVFSGFAFIYIVTNAGMVLYAKGIEDSLMNDVDPVLMGGFVAALNAFTKEVIKGQGELRLIDLSHFKVAIEKSGDVIGFAVVDQDNIAVRTVLHEIVAKVSELEMPKKVENVPDPTYLEKTIDRIVMDVLMRKSINQEILNKLKEATISFRDRILERKEKIKMLLKEISNKKNDIIIRL